MMANKTNPYLIIILVTIIWSTSGGFVKYLQLAPTSLAFIRMTIPVLLIYPFLRPFARRILIVDNRLMLAASGLNVLRLYFFFNAYTLIPIGTAAILLNTWPIFANLFSALILGELIPRRNIILMTTAFFGIILVNLNKNIALENEALWGILAALGTATTNALSIVIFKRQSTRYTWQETIFYQNLLGIVVFAPLFFWYNPLPTFGQISGAIFFSILIGVMAYGLFFKALQSVKASTASLLAYVEVVGATLIGVLFFNEVVTWNLFFGGILVVGAASLIRR